MDIAVDPIRKTLVILMLIVMVNLVVMWYRIDNLGIASVPVEHQAIPELHLSSPISELSEIQRNITNNLIIIRERMINDIKQNIFNSNIYSNLSNHKIYPYNASDVEKYLKEINFIKPIRTVSYSCTVYPDIQRKYPDLPYCGPTFTYYRHGVSHSQCSSKHQFMSLLDFCLDRHNLSVTQQVEHHISKPEDTKTTLFAHVIPYGRVDVIGNVQVGNITIAPKACIENNRFHHSNEYEHVKEVFVISQYWGDQIFHVMIENLPRISLYIEFLMTFDNILIHVGGSRPLITNSLNALGIDPKRLIYGPVVADVVYFPQGGHCGYIRQPEGHLISKYYHKYIYNYLRILKQSGNTSVVVDIKATSRETNSRLNVILMKRSGRRWVDQKQHMQIEQHLINVSNKYGLHYHLFDDRHLPNFNETIAMFYNAALIVAPHGAGLSNVIYAQPETYVIELMCKEDPNFCYGYLSEKQGLHHYILSSDGRGCRGMNLNVTAIIEVIDYSMQMIIGNRFIK